MAKVIITLKEGKQYWVHGQDYWINQPKELDDKKDKEAVDYIKNLPNFEVVPVVNTKKAPAPVEAPAEAPKE